MKSNGIALFGKTTAVLLLCVSTVALAQERAFERVNRSLLDGTSIIYSYLSGGEGGAAYRVRFHDGLLDWTALEFDFSNGDISFRPRGEPVKGSPYKAHKLDDDEYILYFIETTPGGGGNLEFATLHINFNTNEIFAAGMFNYGPNRNAPHAIHWEPGFIYCVTRETLE